MRDYLLLAILVAIVPVCFLRPLVGIYVWYWVGFMNPHRLAWGSMYHVNAAQYVGLATLLGAIAFGAIRRPPRSSFVSLLVVFSIVVTLSTVLAMFPDLAWPRWQSVMKAILMTLLTICLVNSREKLRVLLLVIVLSVGFWAVKAVPWAIRTGGQFMISGPEGTSIASNNDIAMAFNMVLPIAVFFARSEAHKLARWLFRGVALATAAGVFLSYSRGAFLGICAVGMMLILRSRHRFRTIALIVVIAALAPLLMPSKWQTRMNTIQAYREDGSAMERIHTWKFAWGIALDRPFFGGGFQAFRANPLDYDAHNNYFGMLAEHGFLGLGAYLLLILVSFTSLGGIRRVTRGTPQLFWYRDCAGALQASIVGYCVNGLTLGQQYMELFYALIAASAILQTSLRADAAALTATTPSPAIRTGAELEPVPHPA